LLFELLHSLFRPSHLSQKLSRLTLGRPTHYGCTNIVHLSVCLAILSWCRSNTLICFLFSYLGDKRSEAHHASPHARWRRGHRRNHRFGPAKTLTKRMFIRPVFVGLNVAQPAPRYRRYSTSTVTLSLEASPTNHFWT
jgi:hypothetical protein